jgi:uroporphyrinogen decarboxylase
MMNQGASVSRADRFLKACRREAVDATPVWFMRQAGRYMPEYRELRKRHTLLEMVKTPELATQVTLQPVKAFDVDAAIIFADILTLPESMGLDLKFTEGEGPAFLNPVRSKEDVEKLAIRSPEEALGFTLEAIRQTRTSLDGKVPLIGFSGAPFTLACYMIEGKGSREFPITRQFIREQPKAWHALLEKLSQAVGRYLAAQIDAGAQAIQLFDTWAGILSEAEYKEFALSYSAHALHSVRNSSVPSIHFAIGAHLLSLVKEAGGDVIGVDFHIGLANAWQRLGTDVAVQGNLDPSPLLGPVSEAKRQAAQILDSVRGRNGHIFNLGHGILKETPVSNVAELVNFVHEYTRA